jgi:hypothetical protein
VFSRIKALSNLKKQQQGSFILSLGVKIWLGILKVNLPHEMWCQISKLFVQEIKT